MMSGCKKCLMICGAIFLVLGVLFLLKDLERLTLWGIEGITVLFLALGVMTLAKRSCPDCMAK